MHTSPDYIANTHSSTAKLIDTSKLKAPMHEQHQCVFFKVPPELRNRIYKITFENELDSIDLLSVFAHDYLHLHHSHGCASLPQCALLKSCQQVHL